MSINPKAVDAVKKKRNANIELLCVISMLMIITLHYLRQGGILDKVVPGDGFAYVSAWIVEALCYVSVNCFVLITGYYQSDSGFKLRKLISIILEALSYSIIIYLIFCFAGLESFNIKSVITSYLIPIIKGRWWFITVYVVLYCISPYLNILVSHLNKKSHGVLLGTLLLMFSLIPKAVFFSGDVIGLLTGYSLIWFVVLYLTGAYIRRYGVSVKMKTALCLPLYIASSLLTFGVKYLQVFVIGNEYWNLYTYNSPTVYLGAVFLFLFFIGLKEKEGFFSRVWRYLGGSMLAVFMIHTHNLVRVKLWGGLASPSEHIGDVLYAILTVAGIFVACVLIDGVRRLVCIPLAMWKRPWLLLDRIQKKLPYPVGAGTADGATDTDGGDDTK